MHVPQLRGHTDPSTWSADSRRRCRVVAGSQPLPQLFELPGGDFGLELRDVCLGLGKELSRYH